VYPSITILLNKLTSSSIFLSELGILIVLRSCIISATSALQWQNKVHLETKLGGGRQVLPPVSRTWLVACLAADGVLQLLGKEQKLKINKRNSEGFKGENQCSPEGKSAFLFQGSAHDKSVAGNHTFASLLTLFTL
jgi:hypothetical protein